MFTSRTATLRTQRASGTVGALRRLSKKARADEEPVTVAVGGEGNDAARALEEGLFGAGDDGSGEAVAAAPPSMTMDAEIRDDDDEDDFIEYAEGERPLRRPRDAEVSAELAEAREEAEAIFGSAQEMQELLDFTRSGAYAHLAHFALECNAVRAHVGMLSRARSYS